MENLKMKLHIMKSDSLSPYPVFPQSLRPLPWPCTEKQEYICLVNTMPCPTLVAECSQCESNSQIHATGCILQGSKQVEILRVTTRAAGGWGNTFQPSSGKCSQVFELVCGLPLSFWSKFSVEPPLSFVRIPMSMPEFTFSSLGIVSVRITP